MSMSVIHYSIYEEKIIERSLFITESDVILGITGDRAMCGRYLFDVEKDMGLRMFLQEAQQRLKGQKTGGESEETAAVFENGMIFGDGRIKTGEIRPTERAVMIRQTGCHVYASAGYWGFPFQKKQILLARLETILEKPMFSESMLYRRCIVPATGFYEWTHDDLKKKYYFNTENAAHFYMAGIWRTFENGDHFVIVTTEADECTRPVHDRRPVILDWDEAQLWLSDWQSGWKAASLAAPVLNKKCCEEYEQLTLF